MKFFKLKKMVHFNLVRSKETCWAAASLRPVSSLNCISSRLSKTDIQQCYISPKSAPALVKDTTKSSQQCTQRWAWALSALNSREADSFLVGSLTKYRLKCLAHPSTVWTLIFRLYNCASREPKRCNCLLNDDEEWRNRHLGRGIRYKVLNIYTSTYTTRQPLAKINMPMPREGVQEGSVVSRSAPGSLPKAESLWL